jgi:AcrR family transcriptional regulator
MSQPEVEPRPEVRLLNQATSHIAHHGLEGLEVRTLADKAGTSTSQFVRYFGHKDDLLAGVFDRGWSSVERHVAVRLFKPSGSLEDLVEAVLNGVLDAMRDDQEAVAAAIIIAFSTFGQSVRSHLKGTAAHGRFFSLVEQLRAQFAQRLTPQEAREALELLYGAALHRLVLATPMCTTTAPPFDRAAFIGLMLRMVRGLIEPTRHSGVEGSPSTKSQ